MDNSKPCVACEFYCKRIPIQNQLKYVLSN